MNLGGVHSVQSNGVHGAESGQELNDKVVHECDTTAVTQFRLSDEDAFQLMPWSHSIWDEPSFLFPFDAVFRAQCLSFSLLHEEVQCTLGLLQGDSVLDEDAKTITGFAVIEPEHSCVHFPHKPQLRSCLFQNSCDAVRKAMRISFHNQIDLYIGLDEEIQMQSISMPEDLLSQWTEKPWQLRPLVEVAIGKQLEADPLSSKAAWISEQEKIPISHLKTTDEFDNIPRRIAEASTEPRHVPPHPNTHLQPPAFVNDIFGLPGFLAMPPDFLLENNVLIRTWYVHHYHYPRWIVPRIVELDNRWALWPREITSAWRDMIQPGEDVKFFTVLPDADRGYIPRQIIADVLVVQGLDAGRFAGLLTVHHQTVQGHIRPYAIAISLPDEVSGVGLAAAADISHLCNTQFCKFYFGWQNIPFSMIPTHYMLDGHGFSAHITPRPQQAASDARDPSQTTRPATQAARSAQGQASGSQGPNSSPDQSSDREDSLDYADNTPLPDSPGQFEQWQGVQIYRLGRPVVHCFVRWGTYNSILFDIARFLREHLRDLVGTHHIQAVLSGQHEAEDSIILQHVQDLDPGSTEQLIILDVEVHFQALPDSFLRAPEITRRVHRVVPHLARSHVLRLARLANYCFLQGDRCLVFANNELWAEQDAQVRTVQHGHYLKVVASPPVDQTLTTEVALNFAISIDDAESTHVGDCTAAPRSSRALSMMQTQATASCKPGFDRDHNPLHLHVHRHTIDISDEQEGGVGWLHQLADAFSQHAFVECTEEGPVAYVTTWYIDHYNAKRCETNRPVRLVGSESTSWYQVVLDTWADKIDPSAPVSLLVVQPNPPVTETESTLVHIIVEQRAKSDTHAAGVISIIRQDHEHAFVHHVAISSGRLVTFAQILSQVHLVDLCAGRFCRILLGRTRSVFVPNHLEELDSGFGILIFVPPNGQEEGPIPSRLWTPGMAAAMDMHSRSDHEFDDDISFLQPSNGRTFAPLQPRMCKPNPNMPAEDRGMPMILPGRLPRRIRPDHDGAEDWISQISDLFRQFGFYNAWDDERLLNVLTWHIHHAQRPTCRRPREILLGPNPITWIEELRHIWLDVLDPRTPFSIQVVRPRPPQMRTQSFACHIILEQGQQPLQAATVITALLEGYAQDAMIQGAFSVMNPLDINHAIQIMGIAPQCELRRCTLTLGDAEVPHAELREVRSGDCLKIRVSTPLPAPEGYDLTEHLHFEDLSLMQTAHGTGNTRWHRHTQHSTQASGLQRACDTFQFNPSAPPFQPGRGLLDAQSEFVQDLHAMWTARAFAWEDEMPSGLVNVWFVDHRLQLPKCHEPRQTRLFEDFSTWEMQIRQTWNEFLQVGLPVEISIVQPSPPRLEQAVIAHVIVVQAPRDDWSTSLVSILDARFGPEPVRIAVTTHEHVTFEEVVHAVYYDDLCVYHEEIGQCHLWYQHVRITPGHPVPCWSGSSLVLLIEQGGRRISEPVQTDDTQAFLQTALHINSDTTPGSKVEEERLKLDCSKARQALDWLDTHFTMPSFDIEGILESHAHWLPQSLAWIRTDWYAWDAPIDTICIYYDGSFHAPQNAAGSATAAFVFSQGAWKFAGAISVQIAEPPFESYTAELIASLISCKQAYDLAKISVEVFAATPTVEFMFDSISVGKQTEGQWQAKQDPLTCHAIRSILRIMEKRWHVKCVHKHVTGHSGDAENELVDTLANCAAQGKPLQDWEPFLAQIQQKAFVHDLEWAWAFFTEHLGQEWQFDQLVMPAHPTTNPTCEEALPFISHQDSKVVYGEIELQILTCNVLTLLPGSHKDTEHGIGGPTRLLTVIEQLKTAKISIFAFQETRMKTTNRLHNDDFFLVHAPASERGQYGVMLGFSKTCPFVLREEGKAHAEGWFDASHLAIIVAEPRLLIVRVCNTFLKCIIVAAHAPHSGASIEDIEAYWYHVDRCIPAKYVGWPKLLLADANCRFGDSTSRHIGPHGAETSCPKSDAFCQFVAAQNIFLPATFAALHHGPTGTWKHPQGHWTRNDIIGLPFEWPIAQCSSWTDVDMDFSLCKEDHRPVRVCVKWTAQDRTYTPDRMRAKKCPPQMCMEAMQTLLQGPTNRSSMDVHTHFGRIQNDLAACTRYNTVQQGRVPQKAQISADTWALVCMKKKWRTSLSRSQRLQTRTCLHMFFAAWRHSQIGIDFEQAAGSFAHVVRQLDQDIAQALHQFRSLGRQVTQASRRDDVAFYQELAKESSRWLGPSDARHFWKVLRGSLPKFRQRKQGIDPRHLEPLEEQWMPHFTQLEVGTPIQPEELLQTCHDRQRQSMPVQYHFCTEDLPSLMQLEDVLRQTKAHKATGYDVLPSILFRTHPCELADAYFPLLLKMMVWQHEPLAGKGGPLAVIHKKGSQFVASNYRGIMLLPTFTKRVHALLRTQMMQLLAHQRPPGQLGGFSNQQVTYGSQSLQTFGRIMDQLKFTSAVLFLDLTTAFHRLVREWVSGIHVPDDVQQVLQALDAEGLDISDMCERLHLPSLLERLHAPAFLIQLIKDVHAGTWMTIGKDPKFANTKRGTRPGSPLADCVFHFLMADILHQLQDWILQQEEFQSILGTYDIPGGFVAWADDLAIPWATGQAIEMPDELRRILRFVNQLFERYGFLLNFEKGKTSAVVSFRGAGAPQMRQKYQLGPRPGDNFMLGDRTIFLHYVAHYKHLGTSFAVNHGLDVEVQQRIGLANAAFGQIARPILCNRHLPERTRVQLFHTLISTKLFFGLGAWQTPTSRQYAKIRAFLLRLLRKVLRLTPDEVVSTPAAEIMRRARHPEPRVKHAVDRLIYAQRLWEHGPAELQHILHREQALCENSWMHGLLADLEWLNALEIHQPYQPPVRTDDLTELFDYWQRGPKEWQKRIRTALNRYLKQEQMMHKMHRLHVQFMQTLTGPATFTYPVDVEADTANEFTCFCKRVFSTPQGLASHRRLAHNIGAQEKHLIDGVTCPCCLKFLWTRQRLYQHLAYVPRRGQVNHCFQSLQRQGFQVTDETIATTNRTLPGMNRTEALQTLGPLPLFKDSRERDLQLTTHKLVQCESQLVIDPVPEEVDTQQAMLWQRLSDVTQAWFQRFTDNGFDADLIGELPDNWLDLSADQDPTFSTWLESVYIGWGEHAMPEIIAGFIDGEAEALVENAFTEMIYDFPRMQVMTEATFLRQKIRRLESEQQTLFPHRPVKRGSANKRERISTALRVPSLFSEQASWLQGIRKIKFDTIPAEQAIPATVDSITQRPTFLVVHLFSGRRRSTDIHSHLETLAQQFGFKVQVLSLDTAVSIHFGNL